MSADTIHQNPERREQNPPSHRNFIEKILIAILFAAILFILWQGAEVFLLVFAGLLLAVFLRSLSDTLSNHTPLAENWALIFVLLAIIIAVTLGVWFLAPSVQKQFEDLTNELPAVYEMAQNQLSQFPLGKKIVEQMPTAQEFVLGRKSGNIFGRVTGMFSTALDVAVNILIVLMTAIYFAFNPNHYKKGLLKIVPKKYEKRVRETLAAVHYALRKFLLGISGSMAINGTLTFLGLWFLGVPFAIPLGIIAGLLSFIPNIGPLIAGFPAVVIALAQSPTQAVYVMILYLAVQNLDGFIITPLIQQHAVSIPPVLIITAQLLLAVIFGFLGLLLAVPLTAAVFVIVKMLYVEDFLNRNVEVKGEDKMEEY